MNEKTDHISPKQPAEAETFSARIYPESVLKAVWRRIRKPSRKTILNTTYVPGLSIPIFKPESELMIRCFNERPAGSFALDARFISAFDSHEVTTRGAGGSLEQVKATRK